MRFFLAMAALLAMASASFGVTGYSMTYNFAAGDTIKASKIMTNYNQGVNWSTATADTLEKKFVRFTDTKDTTFDTLKAVRVRATTELISSGSLTVANTASVDSLKSTKGITATTGGFSGLVSVDSLKSTKGVSGTFGRFSGALSGTTLTASSTATVDSLKSTKGISATTVTASGVAKADSVASTKGISGTIGNFSGAVSGTTITGSALATVDTLKVTKGAYVGGNVGIKRTAATYPLEVAGTISSNPATGAGQFVAATNTNTSAAVFVGLNEIGRAFTAGQYGMSRALTVFGQNNAAKAVVFTDSSDLIIGAGGASTSSAASIYMGTTGATRLTIASDGAIVPAAIATPANPAASAMQFYFKGAKFIIQYNEGGTQRWKYLDLTGTGVTWQYSATAP